MHDRKPRAVIVQFCRRAIEINLQLNRLDLIFPRLGHERRGEAGEKIHRRRVGGQFAFERPDAQNQSDGAMSFGERREIHVCARDLRNLVFPRNFRQQDDGFGEIGRVFRHRFADRRRPRALPHINLMRQ